MKRNLHAGGHLNGGLSLNILTEDELEEIHLATLELLEDTGVVMECDEALDRFEDAGARVDREAKTVRIPPFLVEDAIRSAPPKVVLAGRDPRHDLVLESTRVHFTNFSEGVMINDPFTGENREPVKQDLVQAARVIDYLDDVDFCEKAIGAHDVSEESAPLHNAEAFL
jgi:trimethylamine--corrinoid protein Co-methyltransferase